MNIVALTTSYPRSADDDSSIFVHRLYQALARSGVSVTVLAPAQEDVASIEIRDGVKIIWFTFLPWGRSQLMYGAGVMQNLSRAPWLAFEVPFFIGKLARLAATEARTADLLHANWIPTGIAAALANLFSRKPIVVTLRGSDARLLKSITARWLSYLGVFRAARITTVSTTLSDELSQFFPALRTRCSVINNGVELPLDPVAKTLLPVLPPLFLVAIGSVVPRKNIEALVNLMQRSELSEYSLVICGKTEDRPYFSQTCSLAERLGVAERIHFVGSLPPRAIPALLERAAAFVTASVYEGRPNALLEALFCGKVSFASNIPAHREIILDGKNGFLFDASDAAAAARGIASALNDTELCEQASKAGKQSVDGHSWKRCAENYSALFSAATKSTM